MSHREYLSALGSALPIEDRMSITAEPAPGPLQALPRSSTGTVAIVHDYLNQRGGAERVVAEMRRIWPDAPIYTALFRPGSTWEQFAEADVHPSILNRIPIDGSFRALVPFYPAAFRAFGTFDADLVISSSSGWAHGVRTSPRTAHVVYCYTPARWIYDRDRYVPRGLGRAASPVLSALRRWDQSAARRADAYVAISNTVRDRIWEAYGIEADVVHPPVDVARFRPRPRGERLLVVSRMLRYKCVDRIVLAASRAGIGLDVVGVGPAFDQVRACAGPTVSFHGELDDPAVTELMERCRAVCVPGAEDFGLVAVEAQAAGKPVVAFAGGGALETVDEGVSGAFFSNHDDREILAAIERVDALETSPDELAERAVRFSPPAFCERLLAVTERAMARSAECWN
jgi:glycosyltransferase involved in cell wall biosynthesis